MPPSAAILARDQRTGPRTALAGHAAGATILELALAEEVDPAVVRRVLRAAGITDEGCRIPCPHRLLSASLTRPG